MSKIRHWPCPLICKQTGMESSLLTAALMTYGSDIQLKEKQKEILRVCLPNFSYTNPWWLNPTFLGWRSSIVISCDFISHAVQRILFISELVFSLGERREEFRMTTTCAIVAYHHLSCEFEPHSWRGVLDKTLCDKVCQWLATGLWISLGTPISATKVVIEIFLKVVLNT